MSLGFSPHRSAFMWTHLGRVVCGRPSRVESVTSIWTCVNVGHSQSCRLFTLESDEGLTCKTMTWTRTKKKKKLSNKTCSVNVASVFLCNKMLFYRPDRVWKKSRVDDHDVTNSELLHEPKHLLSTHGLKSSSSDPALKVMKQKCDIALISRLLKDPESQLRSSKTWVGGRQEQRETEEKEKKKKTEQKIQQHSVPVGPKPELTDQLSTGGDDVDPDSSLRRRRRRSSAVFGSPSPTACSSIPSVSPSPSEAVSVETSGGDEAAAPFTGTKTKTMNR